MVALHLAHSAPLVLYRGTTRRVRMRLFEKGSGGDFVLGRPTAGLSKGPAQDWSEFPIIVAALAPQFPVYELGVPQVAQMRCEWFTTNPAEITLTIDADTIEEAVALTDDGNRALFYSIVARRDTGATVDDEALVVKGPAYLVATAIHSGLSPLV